MVGSTSALLDVLLSMSIGEVHDRSMVDPVISMTGPAIFLDGPSCHLVVLPMIASGFEKQTLWCLSKKTSGMETEQALHRYVTPDVLFSPLGCIISTDGV